jgi:hypothetical protein
MTATNDAVTAGPTTEPLAELNVTGHLADAPATIAAGLREVADWLDAHPELKRLEMSFALVKLDAKERDDLALLARALGDRATEKLVYGDEVRIGATFDGDVDVYAAVPVKKLNPTVPVVPKYRPILSKP